MGWTHTHVWWLRIWKNILVAKIPLEEWGIPAPYRAPQSGAPVLGREAPTISGYKKTVRILSIRVKEKAAGNPGILLKGLHNTPLFPGTLPGLLQTENSSGGTRDIQGEAELCCFRMRGKRTDSCHRPCVESSSWTSYKQPSPLLC